MLITLLFILCLAWYQDINFNHGVTHLILTRTVDAFTPVTEGPTTVTSSTEPPSTASTRDSSTQGKKDTKEPEGSAGGLADFKLGWVNNTAILMACYYVNIYYYHQ